VAKVEGATSRSVVIIRTILQLITNYPCIVAFYGNNSNVGTCPVPSSSPCKVSGCETTQGRRKYGNTDGSGRRVADQGTYSADKAEHNHSSARHKLQLHNTRMCCEGSRDWLVCVAFPHNFTSEHRFLDTKLLTLSDPRPLYPVAFDWFFLSFVFLLNGSS